MMKSKIDTTIQFSGLKPGSYEYSYILDDDFFKAFENENLSAGNVVFDVELEKTERMLLLRFLFNGVVTTECDRCLEPMTVKVEGKEMLCVKFSNTKTSDNEDELIMPENAYQIDLAEWMYEYVLVAMPLQHIHPDDENGNSTCNPEMLKYINGIADTDESMDEEDADKTDNESIDIDPRWAKLLELK